MMKRIVVLALVLVMLAGCSSSDEVEYLESDIPVVETLIVGESLEVLYREDELSLSRMISYIDEGKEVLLSNNGPTHPEINGDRSLIAFINNAYWEAIGEVLLFDGEKGITSFEYTKDQYTPKDLEWLDDSRLLVVVGYAYGTVSRGGDLYLFDIDLQEVELIYEAKDHEEVVQSMVTPDGVSLTIIHFDENYESFETYNMNLTERFD